MNGTVDQDSFQQVTAESRTNEINARRAEIKAQLDSWVTISPERQQASLERAAIVARIQEAESEILRLRRLEGEAIGKIGRIITEIDNPHEDQRAALIREDQALVDELRDLTRPR